MVKENSPFPLPISAAILIGSLIIAVSILVAGGVIRLAGVNSGLSLGSQSQTAGTQNGSPTPSANPRISGVTAGNLPVLGDSNAKVTVVEFADYRCPFCEQFFTDSYPQIKKDYIDTGKIKFAFRDFPFLPNPASDPTDNESANSANAARCANEQGKFWDYHDYLYSHQGSEDAVTFSKDNLKKFAVSLGLNADQFNQCVDSNKYAQAVTDDLNAGKGYGVNGTPTIFVNGLEVVGAEPYSVFQQIIDQELANAK